MKIVIPKDNYSDEERKKISIEYQDYLNELKNQELIKTFINPRIKYNDSFLKFQNLCFFIISFSIINIILALLSLTVFKEYDWYLILDILLPPFIFAPIYIFNWIDSLLRKIFCEIITHQKDEKNNMIKLYEKNVYEKYEKTIKEYEEIVEYDNKVNKLKKDFRNSIMEKLFSLGDKQFKETIIMLFSDKYNMRNSNYKNCLICSNGTEEFLLMFKKIKRSISIADIKRFEEYIKESNAEYGELYYIGDISTKAVRYCTRKQNKRIFLFNHYDICNSIYDYKMKVIK